MSEKAPDAIPTITPRHYQALCGLSVAAIVLTQMQYLEIDASIKLALHAVLLSTGALAILNRARISPVLVLVIIAVPYLIEQQRASQFFRLDFGRTRFLDVGDVLVCIAALSYFIGHYRLIGLRVGVLPADRRLLPDATTKATPPQARSEKSLSMTELAMLAFVVPSFALLAQFASMLLQRWRFLDIDPRINEFVLLAWVLLLNMFLTAHAFRYWRRLQMDRVSALLLLQDTLWEETRGEQRRIQRWLAWKKLRENKK
jgi:hypothetical protein